MMTRAEAGLHDTIASRLGRSGQRYTAHRESLVRTLERSGKPLTLPDILDETPGLPQSSAYRNLVVLEHAGVVRRVITDEGFARYELAEALTEHHHHLVCSACGRVEDLMLPGQLEGTLDRTLDRLARRAGFAQVVHRLDLIGVCGDCVGSA